MQPLAVHYSYGMVVLSVAISVIAAYAAFSLADRMHNAETRKAHAFWLTCGSCAMGMGIWSMHYVGMFALHLPVDVYYFLPTVLFSLLMAIAASVVALLVVSSDTLGKKRLAGAGLLMGAGIGAMHYTGMAAMRADEMHHYTPWIVILSLAVAWGFSTMALGIGFSVRRRSRQNEWIRMAAGTMMGLGIAAMHYTAMAGVTYTPAAMNADGRSWDMYQSTVGGIGVGITTIFILLVTLGGAALDKRRLRILEQSQADLLVKQGELLESRQQLLASNELLNELSIRDGLTGLYNRRYFDATFETEWQRAARGREKLSLLMIDLDHFKELNDHYGHQTGDECLREVARVLDEQPKRRYDVVARYGGEEFVVLLPARCSIGPLNTRAQTSARLLPSASGSAVALRCLARAHTGCFVMPIRRCMWLNSWGVTGWSMRPGLK
jgi:NO-binding membrane sensor protein with MHYT domain/GGDEF domain-containing protein